jgi:uncharacterized membrane protein
MAKTIFNPEEVSLGRIICPSRLEYLVSASNESLVVDIQGYDVENPTVTIEYQQPLEETESEEGSSEGNNLGYILLIVVVSVLAIALFVLFSSTLKRREADNGRHAEEPQKAKGELEVTPEMARVMETLTDRERAIFKALLKHNGEMTQAGLRYETEIPKSSLTGILRTLERRQIIKKKE